MRTVGRYEVDAVLGRGTYSTVYRARSGDSVLAVKLLHTHLAADEVILRRFIREGQLSLKLSHPSIVRTQEIIEGAESPAIVMEYMPGGNLRNHDPMTVDALLAAAVSIAEALSYTHRRGVIHRAVRPENILFDSDGQAKLSDFGSAHINDLVGLTTSTLLSASPAFVAPEVAAGGNADPRSDLYSLGVTLFERLTGHLPGPDTSAECETVTPLWLGEVLAGLLSARETRIGSAERLSALLRSGSAPKSDGLRSCVHCRARTPRGLPVCVACGNVLPQILESAGPDAESLILKSISERHDVLEDFLFALRCLSGDENLKVNILTGDIRLYSRDEKKNGLRLPVRIIDRVSPSDADRLIRIFERTDSHKIHIYRRRTDKLRSSEKRGPLISPESGPAYHHRDLELVRRELVGSPKENLSSGLSRIDTMLVEVVEPALRFKQVMRAGAGGVTNEATVDEIIERARSMAGECRRIGQYLSAVELGGTYAAIRRLDIGIAAGRVTGATDELMREKRSLIEVYERYRGSERRYGALVAGLSAIGECLKDATAQASGAPSAKDLASAAERLCSRVERIAAEAATDLSP